MNNYTHCAMVRRRPHSAIPSRHSNRYSGQDSQTADSGGDSGSLATMSSIMFSPLSISAADCNVTDDQVDVRHRMDIAQTAFGSLSHLWTDRRLSREKKLRLYKLSVCSTLTHCCTAWALTRTLTRMIMYAPGQDSATRTRRSGEGWHMLSRGQPLRRQWCG